MLDAPPSPPPPPLEDDIPEGKEYCGETANNLSTVNLENFVNVGDDMPSSDCHGGMDLEELLKQRTFTRSEFEYLAELLRSRTVGYNKLQEEASNIKQMRLKEKENGSRDLPFADQVASPAELAKAYMGSRCSEGLPLRLRLHDPSTLPKKSIDASTTQKAKSPKALPLPSSRSYASTPFPRLGSNYMTPNKSAIHKMSSSPYFKGPVSSRDMSSTVLSSYQTANSVHTFGRQVLKRKSTALNNETVSVGPIRKMRQRYNRVSPLLETRPGYRGFLGSHASKLEENFEHSSQTQKRRCLDKIDDVTQGVYGNSFGQAPAQSTEMAAKILKQLDSLVPSQKEGASEIMQKHWNTMDVEDSVSRRKEISGSFLESSLSGVQEYSLLNNFNGAAKFTPATIDVKNVDATSNISAAVESKSSSERITSPKDSRELDNYSGTTKVALHQANDKIEKSQPSISEHATKNSATINKEKPSTFSLRSYSPSNLVLSSEIDRSQMLASSNGFSFPATTALGAHSQAPPTPTMASPPVLPVGKHQSSAVPRVPVTSAETAARIAKQVSEAGTISNKHDKKSDAEIPPISSKSAEHVASFTSNHVFSVVSSKPATLSNGLAHSSKSTTSAVLPSNGSNNSVLFTNTGVSTSFPQFSFQSGFQTSLNSAQQSGGVQFKAESIIAAPFSMQCNSTGGSPSSSSTFSQIFAGTTSQSVEAPPSGSGSAPSSFSPKFSGASLLAAQDKSKEGSSSTPFNFSPQFGSVVSVASLGKSNVTSPESALFSGNKCAQSGNNNLLSTQSSASKFNLVPPEKSNMGNLPNFASSPFCSAPLSSSPSNSSSIFPFTAASGSTSLPTTAPLPLPASSSTLGASKAFSVSPIFGSNLATTAPSLFGMQNTGSAFSPSSSTSSAVFSFTAATPTIPDPSPSTPLSGQTSPAVGLNTGTDQMNGGLSTGPLSTAPQFNFQSNSPSAPVFSTPATQFASTTPASPGIFQFGQQSQPSPGGFSMGIVRDNDKSGRRIIKAKRKK